MKARTILYLVGSTLGLGLATGGTGGLILGHSMGERTPEEIEGWEMVTVLAAAEEIPQGTIVDKPSKRFVEKRIPIDSLPPGAVTEIDERLFPRALTRTLETGSVLCGRDLVKLCAMTLRVDIEEPIAYSLKVGVPVDLLLKRRDSSRASIIPHVCYLARNNGDVFPENYIGPLAVILAVRPTDREKILAVLGAEDTKIILVLHKTGKHSISWYQGFGEPEASAPGKTAGISPVLSGR